MKKYFVEEKPQMRKTNVEKKLRMKLSSCFFSDLVSLTCGKLIGYEKARELLHKYVSLFFFANYNIIIEKNKNRLSPRVICDISIYIIEVLLTGNPSTPLGSSEI